jgi:predicted GIY-YIG superfamily endonuclease
MLEAIAHEKILKKLARTAKISMIETNNPLWRDLTSEIEAWGT